jgi:tetraacyldisaccharide 4'-kinase
MYARLVLWLNRRWYGKPGLLRLLAPLSMLFAAIVRYRRRRAQAATLPALRAPVVVVGNLTAGGSGKTPFVAYLAQHLLARGRRPCIVSRGYGGAAPSYPRLVTPASDPRLCGDEPVELARATGCPVVVDPMRINAARWGIELLGCDVILSDDGLQHYGLPRNLEVLVANAQRSFGNGRMLPVGPLREPLARARSVDLFVEVGDGKTDAPMACIAELEGIPKIVCDLIPDRLVNLRTHHTISELKPWPLRPPGAEVIALTGIAHPDGFYADLTNLGCKFTTQTFADHADYAELQFDFKPSEVIVTTAKDAVKLRPLLDSLTGDWWVLERRVEIDTQDQLQLDNLLREIFRTTRSCEIC